MSDPVFAPWEPATGRCSGRARPGARSLMLVITETLDALDHRDDWKNWGIYNCRDTALGNPSAHSDGRADDVGCTIAAGNDLVHLLRTARPARLGISVIIHNRVIYSAKSPNGRRYNGVPHTDHVHIELTRAAANTMTTASIRRILATPAAANPTPGVVAYKPGSRVLKPGSTGPDVKWLQKRLAITADGVYGPRTEQRVRHYQAAHHLPVDGGVGPKDWAKLLRTPRKAA